MTVPRDITASALKSRISAELQGYAESAPCRRAWRLRCADELGIHPDRFKCYLYGETVPGLEDWLRLCVYFGAGLKSRVEEPAGFVTAPRGGVVGGAAQGAS